MVCAVLTAVLAVLVLNGCGGRSVGTAGQGPGAQDGGAPWDGLPGLPHGADDPAQSRGVSLADNIETGNQAIKSSPSGVFVNGSGLDMGPVGKNKSGWAIWRWGVFQVGNLPRMLKTGLTINPQSNTYWVALSNYTTGRWQVLGPFSEGAASYTYNPGDNYVSPSANTYVALLVTDTNKLTVGTLNLVCDNDVQPPGPPTGLQVKNIAVHAATLRWTAPADDDINHYEVYSGPADGFQLTDAGVTLLSDTVDKDATQLPLTGLTPETEYFLRMRTVDAANNISGLSATVTFTTNPNGPPVPAFIYQPTDVQKDAPVTFNPGGTTDPDDAPDQLTTSWDWDNDGTDDLTNTGLLTAEHTFTSSGAVTVKLTVSDGTASVSTTASFLVGQHVETVKTGYALGGDPATVLAADVDYATGRIAAVIQGAGSTRLRYFDGVAWATVDMSSLMVYTFADVTLAPGGKVGVLMIDFNDADVAWRIFETSGTDWTETHSMTLTGQKPSSGGTLAYGSNGRVSVAMTHAVTPPFGQNPSYTLSVYHQKADSTFIGHDGYTGTYPARPFRLKRSDDQSICIYQSAATAGNIVNAVVTDAGGSNSNKQAIGSGQALAQLALGSNPADTTQVFWAGRSATRIYYGDNFGTANPSGQFYTPSRAPKALLAVGPAGDNKGLFYWSDIDASDDTWIRGFNTNTSSLFEVNHGAGLCDAGYGGWLNLGGNDGVYTAVSEARDGEVIGYLLSGATVVQQDTISAPVGGATIGNRSLAFLTNDGGFAVLNRQDNPTALLHLAPSISGTFTHSLLGADTWAYPDCAASGTVPGELLLGSLYNSTDLLLYRFPAGAATGTYMTKLGGVEIARMQYNPVTNQTLLVYSQNSSTSLEARLWDGAAWSGATVLHSGANLIADVMVRARPDGEWGVAWDDSGSNVRMAETSAGAWQPAVTLANATLHFGVGSVALEYNANGDAGLAVERNTGAPGVFFGSKPLGSTTATWDHVIDTSGFNVSSLNVHFTLGVTPVIVYYDNDLGIQFAQQSGADWSVASLPFYIKGTPLVSVMDAAGTLAVVGKDNSTGQSAVCILVQ
jgi:hypothetical protein